MWSEIKDQKETMELGNDKDWENFSEGLGLGIKNKKELVFYNSNLYINSATDIAQYIFPDNFLVTLFGELHDQEWICNSPNMSISKYIKNRVENNGENIKIILEYNPGLREEDILKIGSHGIRNTYTELKNINKLDKIYPYDSRPFFLTPELNTKLYNGIEFLQFTKKYIFDTYISVFFQKSNEFEIKEPDFINPYLFSILISIRKQIELFFINITPHLDTLPITIIREELKQVWQKICDWFVLKELYTKNNITEYIFIGGQYHYNYIGKELLNTGTMNLIDVRNGNKDKCINLYHTYQFK